MASIDKRSNGKYRARWREFPGGPQRTRHFQRKVDAEQFLVDVQHRILSGAYVAPDAGRMTVRAYSEEWVARRSWAPATHDRIARELRLHILPRFGERPLSSLRRSHIEEWAKTLPLAASSARMVYETLSNMLAAAVDDERIVRNPAKGARLARATAAPFVPLTGDEVRLLAHTESPHLRGAVLTAAGTGLRQGELFGLTVDRVDFLRREMRIDRQLWTPPKGAPILKEPKSRNSYRTSALSPLLVDVLSAHIASFGTGAYGLVFHSTGKPIPRANAMAYMRRLTKRAELAATWHDLRHHHASSLLAAGVNPAKVAERLGHDLKTLLTTYAHVMPKDDDRVRAIVDATLGGSAEDWLRTKAV